jgi:chromate transporter
MYSIMALMVAVATIGFYGLYVSLKGIPSGSMIGSADSTVTGTSYSALLELGLIAGMVTFGGAYTTLPFIYAAAVTSGGWLTDSQFLDAIAITNMMPTPLVTFVTVVGWIGHGIGGAVIIAIGIFLPAFSFTLIGHKFFEKVVDNKLMEPFLDGVGAAVIGLLLYTSFQFLKGVIETGLDSSVFVLSFLSIFYFTDKYTQPITIIVSAMAGQILNQYD